MLKNFTCPPPKLDILCHSGLGMGGHGGIGMGVGGSPLAMGLGLGASGLNNGAQDLSLPKRESGSRNGHEDEEETGGQNSLGCGPFNISRSKADTSK